MEEKSSEEICFWIVEDRKYNQILIFLKNLYLDWFCSAIQSSSFGLLDHKSNLTAQRNQSILGPSRLFTSFPLIKNDFPLKGDSCFWFYIYFIKEWVYIVSTYNLPVGISSIQVLDINLPSVVFRCRGHLWECFT